MQISDARLLLFEEVWLQGEAVELKVYLAHLLLWDISALWQLVYIFKIKLTLKYIRKVVHEHRDSRQCGGVVYSQRNRSLFENI